MKSFLFSAVLFFLVHYSFGQGNLQFNQVLTYSGSFNSTMNATQSSSVFTVPPGKVWKLEAYSYSYYYTGSNRFRVNYLNDSPMDPSVSSNAPIWLKSGDYIFCKAGNLGLVSNDLLTNSWFFSIIEYNIIP